jgi:S-adenosylmethionine:tRNA ribosyltransferase-isomerase
MDVTDFDYALPADLIAQYPPVERDAGRLLVLDRRANHLTHTALADLPRYLCAGDLLVVNDSRVFPARLIGRRVPSGGAVECLLVQRLDTDVWEALMHPGQKLRPGSRVVFERAGFVLSGEVVERKYFGRRLIRFDLADGQDLDQIIDAIGHVPLPPYIRRGDEESDRERYQTVYARVRGSVAAPTAGLHLTPSLLNRVRDRGIERVELTLHVGYGTFKPVRVARVEDHEVDLERFEIAEAAARAVTAAIGEGRRIVAVGTTTTRALESAARMDGSVKAGSGETRLFIYPGFEFRAVTGLLTNFHLPQSSLLMLVCALAGRERVIAAYREAVERRYRFYSYGDAMLIL